VYILLKAILDGAMSNSHLSLVVKRLADSDRLGQLSDFLAQNNVGSRTIKRIIDLLLSPTPEGRINKSERQLILKFEQQALGNVKHYDWLVEAMGRPREQQKGLRSYVGKYDQFFATDRAEELFSKATLEISEREGKFEYRNELVLSDGIQRHYEGMVFIADAAIYFTGINKNYFRPMLCYPLAEKQSIVSSCLTGAVLGLKHPTKEIYLREFVLVHRDNVDSARYNLQSDEKVSQLFPDKLKFLLINKR